MQIFKISAPEFIQNMFHFRKFRGENFAEVCFMIEKRLAKIFFQIISWYCNIYTYLLILTNFTVHLVFCLDVSTRKRHSVIGTAQRQSFSL